MSAVTREFEERLQAFLDGQMSVEDADAFMNEIEQDDAKMMAFQEEKQFHELLQENSGSAAAPLNTQRALAERIPVLQEIDPRLAPLPHDGGGATATTAAAVKSGSKVLLNTLRTIGIVGVTVVGSWYAVTQFSSDDDSQLADTPQEDVQHFSEAAPNTDQPTLEDDAASGQTESTESAVAVNPVADPNEATSSAVEQNEATSSLQEPASTLANVGEENSLTAEADDNASTAPARESEAIDDQTDASVQSEQSQDAPTANEAESQFADGTRSPQFAATTRESSARETVPAANAPVFADRIASMHSNAILRELQVSGRSKDAIEDIPGVPVAQSQYYLDPELAPEDDGSAFFGYIGGGGSQNDLFLTGFGNSNSIFKGMYLVGLQYKITEHVRFGVEFGRSQFSRQQIGLESGFLPTVEDEGVIWLRQKEGSLDQSKTWLQLHSEYVFNPEDDLRWHAEFGAGSVLDGRLTPHYTLGIGAGYELFSPVVARLGLYYSGAWLTGVDDTRSQLDAIQGPVGIIYTGVGQTTKYTSAFDLRFGLGISLW